MGSSVAESTTESRTLDSPESSTEAVAGPAAAAAAPRRNFVVLAAYQVVLRTGWIFKTESIIMPAVLDLLGGGALLRGCLPVLNRFGTSVPPLLMSRRIHLLPRKRAALAVTGLLMGGSFLTLAAAWHFRQLAAGWMPALFLLLYAVFFMSNGVNQLSMGTLSGKLVRANRRGWLMLNANVIGAALAICCAALLLPRWLVSADGIVWVFAFAGSCFVLAAGTALLLDEPKDNYRQPPTSLPRLLHRSWAALRSDRDFRRVACVAALFGTSFMLFPHYQAIALGQAGRRLGDMMVWVVVQNTGTALFSLLMGPVADRHGNRLVLRVVMLCVLGAPLLAIALPLLSGGAEWFPLVFLLVGMTPVTLRTLQNYTLEIAEPADHPLYLSTLSLVVATPVLLSPLVGALIHFLGFGPVFVGISALVLAAWLLTLGMAEPRHRRRGTRELTIE